MSVIQCTAQISHLRGEINQQRLGIPYAFLLCGHPTALEDRFAAAGLVCRQVGVLDDSATLRLRSGSTEVTVWDLRDEPLAGLVADDVIS